jgi:hypothetical protein
MALPPAPQCRLTYHEFGSAPVFHTMPCGPEYFPLLSQGVIMNEIENMTGMTGEEANAWDEYFTKETALETL